MVAPRDPYAQLDEEDEDYGELLDPDDLPDDALEHTIFFLLVRYPKLPYLNLSYQDILDLDEQEAMIYLEWLREAVFRTLAKLRR